MAEPTILQTLQKIEKLVLTLPADKRKEALEFLLRVLSE